MATATEERVVYDPETLHTLDQEWAIQCEFILHKGPEPARWVMYPACCSVAGSPFILGCDDCKDRKTHNCAAIHCDECDKIYAPASLAWRLIEPLNRRSA